MSRRFRVIDTGLRSGRENIAFDQAMIDARSAGAIPDSIRFIHFKPSALIGRHQALSQEIKVEYCRAHGIDVVRRITGGGAIYFDEGQLGWALVCGRKSLGELDLAGITRAICEAAAAGLSTLGVEARFRPRNDIEIGGRKISGTGGFFEGDALMFQGTVLIDLNPANMIAALNIPEAKLAKRSLDDAAQRVTTLKQELGAAPDVEAVKAALIHGFERTLGLSAYAAPPSDHEEALAKRLYVEEIGTDAFVFEIDDPTRDASVRAGEQRSAGGTVTAYVRLEGPNDARIREVLFTGDFFVAPPRLVYDLEARLRGVPAGESDQAVADFFAAQGGAGLLSIKPEDFAAALRAALEGQAAA